MQKVKILVTTADSAHVRSSLATLMQEQKLILAPTVVVHIFVHSSSTLIVDLKAHKHICMSATPFLFWLTRVMCLGLLQVWEAVPCYRILALPHPTWRSTHAPGSRIEITNDLCQSASKQHAPLPLPLPEIMPKQQQEVRCKTNQISYLHDDTTKSKTSIKNFNVCDRNDYKPL